MPIAASNPHIIPVPAKNSSQYFPKILVSFVTSNYLNTTIKILFGSYLPKKPPVVKNHFDNLKVTNDAGLSPVFGPVFIRPGSKFECYTHNVPLTSSPVELGNIPDSYCTRIWSPCIAYSTNDTLNETQAAPGSKCAMYFTVPDVMGTYAQTDVMWLCGYNMYLKLPTDWKGLCALVHPADHSYIISAHLHSDRRVKRGFKPHDAIWGTDVPPDHKLWTQAQKVALSLFPQLGVGKVMLRMETLYYQFSGFVNSTIAIMEAERVELQSLRAVALQNRLVLDQITASSGGVCVIVGSSCCTYIPDYDGDGKIIEQGLANLTQLPDTIDGDFTNEESWIDWLFLVHGEVHLAI